MLITHSYLGTNRNGARCLFFLLFQDYIEAENGFSKEVAMELEQFARDLGDFGFVVKPFTGDISAINSNIIDKRWTEEERYKLKRTPALLMIDRDFDDFDPSQDRWALIQLDTSIQSAAKLRSLLGQIADTVKSDQIQSLSFSKRLSTLRDRPAAPMSAALETYLAVSLEVSRKASEAAKSHKAHSVKPRAPVAHRVALRDQRGGRA